MNFFQVLKDNYEEDPQKTSETVYEDFLQYYRKPNQTIQDYTAEWNRRFAKANL